ncbi:restriction endonuclease [Neisseria gonorrhoeae]|uniref:Restriction endonuclease n=2 Tax=Neisseria gonorrhoeae TaxID=485 RepID=A0AAX2TRS2_NEIGO|nr:Putative Modification methylase DpnIIB [Neisseria gonorrhoeae NCCP11945]AVI59961.1 restriction endonuclease [Neisseria gonorrhoeae]AZG19683.1 restriction endonuclease [Neisseria gonorrhoeae]AZG26587.1 restriction endonuclease [Neisseria gonorrhoeae]AZG31179.1 restriction endonuclease [Neisseria gonorrhoeae]
MIDFDKPAEEAAIYQSRLKKSFQTTLSSTTKIPLTSCGRYWKNIQTAVLI